MKEENKTTSSLAKMATIDDMVAFGERLVKTGMTPMKRGEDVMAAILMGQELGFGAMVAVNNVYSINGRASVGIHIITGLLLKAGIVTEILEDYIPLYRYKDESSTVHSHDDAQELLKEGKKLVKSLEPYDRRVKIKFKRKLKQPDGTYEPMEVIQVYTLGEAKSMGFLDKDNWIKQPKTMLKSRCLTLGGRLIGSDVLLGLLEHTELADITQNANIKVDIDQNGNTTINKTEDITFEEIVDKVKEVIVNKEIIVNNKEEIKEEQKDNNNPEGSEVPATNGTN